MIHLNYYRFNTSGRVIGPEAVAATPEERIPTYGMRE